MELFVSYNVDFIDAYNTVMMQSQDIDLIYSYDSDFELLEDVTRKEPWAIQARGFSKATIQNFSSIIL